LGFYMHTFASIHIFISVCAPILNVSKGYILCRNFMREPHQWKYFDADICQEQKLNGVCLTDYLESRSLLVWCVCPKTLEQWPVHRLHSHTAAMYCAGSWRQTGWLGWGNSSLPCSGLPPQCVLLEGRAGTAA